MTVTYLHEYNLGPQTKERVHCGRDPEFNSAGQSSHAESEPEVNTYQGTCHRGNCRKVEN